ncbi:MAG: Hint domain-containing protein [Pikeienuella sp.]
MVVNTDNVADADNAAFELLNLRAITTGVVIDGGGDPITMVFVGGNDDGISVFQLEDDNTLTSLFNLDDAGALELENLRELEFVTINGNPILIAGGNDDAVSSFSVAEDGTLVELDAEADDATRLMNNINAMTTYEIGGNTFIATGNAAGAAQEGITTYSIDDAGQITVLAQVADNSDPNLLLNNIRDIEAVNVGGTTFLVAAGDEDGLNVFSVDALGALTNTDIVNDSDDAAFRLTNVQGLATAQVGGSTFVYAAGHEAGVGTGGISVFELDGAGTLTNVQNITEPDADFEIDQIQSVEAIVGPSGETFIYIVGNDDALQQFFVAADGTIDLNVSEIDNGTTFLGNARDVALLNVNDEMVAISGGLQDGISVFTVPCFTPGTMIDTPFGQRKVETLKAGDFVLTRDRGPQMLRYVARRVLDGNALDAAPHLLPVVIGKGTLGDNLPHEDLVVSPQHRMLIGGAPARLLFGFDEVLAPAVALRGERMTIGSVEYLHLVFEDHQVITANGAATESFYPGAMALNGLDAATRAEVLEIFPELSAGPEAGFGAPARPILRPYEARVWVDATAA